MFIVHKNQLVYEYVGEPPVVTTDMSGVAYSHLDMTQVDRFFSDERQRKTEFNKFVRRGFLGVVLHCGSEWVTFAWMSTPHSPQPIHLPAWVADLNAFWIFYCQTKNRFRNRGYYKTAMRLLIAHAREREFGANVYIDTTASNVQSRRAITDTGFQPRGVLACTRFGIPRIGYMTVGKWERDAQHPELPSRLQEAP